MAACEVRYGGKAIPVTIPSTARDAFLSGQWDPIGNCSTEPGPFRRPPESSPTCPAETPLPGEEARLGTGRNSEVVEFLELFVGGAAHVPDVALELVEAFEGVHLLLRLAFLIDSAIDPNLLWGSHFGRSFSGR